MNNGFLQSDLFRTLFLTLLGAIAVVTVAMANRDVYTKSEIDARFVAEEKLHAEQNSNLVEDVSEIKDDLKWIIREMGGRSDSD